MSELPETEDLTSTPVTKPEAEEKKSPTHKKKLLLVLLLLLLLLLIGLGIYFFWPDSGESNSDNSTTSEEDDTDTTADTDTGVEATPAGSDGVEQPGNSGSVAKRIVYLKDDNIFIMDSDGSAKTQITDDGNGDSVRYTAVAWKDSQNIGYSRCAGECKIYSVNTVSLASKIELTPPPFTQSISAITWTTDGSKLGYLFTKADGSSEALVVAGDNTVSIATFGPVPGRGVSYSDGVDMAFSPDRTRVLVFNTFQPFDGPTTVISEANGDLIENMDDTYTPTFDGNDGFYFKSGDSIRRFNLADSRIVGVYFLGAGNSYNLQTSPDGNFLSFWNEDSGTGIISLYYLDVAGSPAKIADNLTVAKWLDANTLIAIKTTSPVQEMGYEYLGLAKVNRATENITTLVDGAVTAFAVAPAN